MNSMSVSGGVQLVDQLDSVIKLLNSKTVLVVLDGNGTALAKHAVTAEIITSKAELLRCRHQS